MASYDPGEFRGEERPLDPLPAVAVVESPEINHHGLEQLVAQMRAAPSSARDVDEAYGVFLRIAAPCIALSSALVRSELERQRSSSETASVTGTMASVSRRNSDVSVDSVSSFGPILKRTTVIKKLGSTPGEPHPGPPSDISWLSAVRNWKHCLEILLGALRVSLMGTYRSCDEEATADVLEQLFTDKKYREFAILNLRESSSTRDILAKPDFVSRRTSKWETFTADGSLVPSVQGTFCPL
jgi:hypothetical protein